jgi:hypothetical protein
MVMTPEQKLAAWWRGQETDSVRRDGAAVHDRTVVLYHWNGIQITAKEMRELVAKLEEVK